MTTALLIAILGLGLAGYWKLSLTGAAVSLLAILFRRWMQGPEISSTTRLDGKTVVITGATSGIGKTTAMGLSKRGAKVVLLCRNIKAAEEVAEEMRKSSKEEVIVEHLDLASLESVRKCADSLANTLKKINILINNAGIADCPEMRTKEGFEMQIGTNHFGHFLLTNLLLPWLKKGGPDARIINVSSMLHDQAQMNWDDLNWENTPYNSLQAYCQSKLANILFTKELARRLEGSGVNTYAVHPGVINTPLARYQKVTHGLAVVLLWTVVKHLMKTPESGANTSIFCSVEESLASQSGLYYSDCQEQQPAPQAEDREGARKLWELSEQLVGLKQG